MPLLDDFITRYYSEGERKEIFRLLDEVDGLEKKIDEIGNGDDILNKAKELTSSDLEIAETQQERIARIEALELQYKEIAEKHRDYLRDIRSLYYEIDSIKKKAYSRYSKEKNLSEIFQDCLEIIDSIDIVSDDQEITDGIELYCKIETDRVLDLENVYTPLPEPEPPIIQCSYGIYQQVNWYLDYFKGIVDSPRYFKILKAIYDKTLVYFPDGFTDQDKQNEYCIFDQEFFQALDAWKKEQADKKAVNDYELSILANYRPDIKRHILPSNPKITATMFALGKIGMIGTELHQISIDDYIKENNKANDLVTFQGLDDDGLTYVFNKNIAKKDDILVSFKNLENARGGGTAPSKIFGKVIEKMTLLGYYIAPNINTAVTISVKDLTEDGTYANKTSGKRALVQAEKTLSELMVNFYNEKIGMDVNVNWFSAIGWKDKSTLLLMPNKGINWRLIGSHFVVYPIYIYRLNTHAYKLAYYIFTQARINKDLNEDGDIIFKLSLVNISRELGLPTVESIKNFKYKQNILDKIILAMKEIEDADQESYGKDHRLVYLKLDHKKNQSPKEIIETANLVVTIKKGHDVTESYKEIRDRKTDIIDSAKRKKEKAKRQAREKTDQP